MSYEFFVSLRYLRAKRKQVFVSVITFISVAGIFLGVAALIIVLAVIVVIGISIAISITIRRPLP